MLVLISFNWIQLVVNGYIWHIDITKPIIFQFFVQLTSFAVAILVAFYCFTTPIVPSVEEWFQSWPPKRVSIADDPYWNSQFMESKRVPFKCILDNSKDLDGKSKNTLCGLLALKGIFKIDHSKIGSHVI